MRASTVSLALCVCLFSCGGDGAAGGAPEILDIDPVAATEPIELTDELMAKYVEIAKDAKAVSKDGDHAFLVRHGWRAEQWIRVSSAVTNGLAAAGAMTAGATELDRRNAATVQRWLPKLEAIDKAK